MSVEGKKIALSKVFGDSANSYFKAASKIRGMGLPVWAEEAQIAGIKSIVSMRSQAVINTPADRFNDDGTLKPYEPKEGGTLIALADK